MHSIVPSCARARNCSHGYSFKCQRPCLGATAVSKNPAKLPQHRGLSIARAASNQDKDEALPQEQPEKKNEAAQLDSNRLQTSLSRAVASEDYAQAAQIRDQLNSVSGSKDGKKQSPPAGWQGLGIPEWLADRVERLGFMMPTDIQRESSKLMMLGADVFLSAQTGSGKTLAFLIPVLAMLDYQPGAMQTNLPGPQAVIIVPHRELGVQITLLAYRLLGGSINNGSQPGQKATLFTYTGPSGVNVRGILDKQEVIWTKTVGYVDDCHIVVGTADCLAEVLQDPNAQEVLQHTKVVVVDEADECLHKHREALTVCLDAACTQEDKPSFGFVGATIDSAFQEEIVKAGWPHYPAQVQGAGSSLVPPAIQHRFVVVPQGMAPGSLLAKMLRTTHDNTSPDAPYPRVLVFAADAKSADTMATALRAALWEEYRIGLVLPDGEFPTKMLQDFKEGLTSMIILTPEIARGLDLPGVSHVFNLDVPGSSKEYLHRAGRLGRIGADSGGVLTTLVSPERVGDLLGIASDLGISSQKQDVEVSSSSLLDELDSESGVSEGQLDKSKKLLEDVFNLY